MSVSTQWVQRTGADVSRVGPPGVRSAAGDVIGREKSRRTVLSIMMISLAIVTALVLLRTARLLDSPVTPVDHGTANRHLTHRFYEAINTTLATGDAGALNDLVAPTLSITNSDPRVETGRDGLIERLLALHRSQPNLRFVVHGVYADTSTAIAWVSIDRSSEDVLLATPLWAMGGEAIDRLTIVEGQIIEMHAIVWDMTSAILLAQADVQRPAPDVQIGIARMKLDGPTIPFALSALGPIVIVVESGSVKVQGGTSGTWSRVTDGSLSAASTIDIGVTQELHPGDQFVSPSGSPFVLLNDEPTPATVLVVAVIPLAEWTRGTSGNDANTQRSTIILMMNVNDDTLSNSNLAFPPGVHATRIAVQLTSLDEGWRRLRLERIDLAPNAELRMQSRSVARVIAVEQDTEGLIIQQRGENGQQGVAVFKEEDEPVFVQSPSQATVRNLGESTATLLILSWQ